MVAFHVGMCAHNGSTAGDDFATTSVTDRFQVLKQCILNVFGYMTNTADLYCFIAPEFFFGNVALPKSDYKTLKTLCGGLFSAQNLILVPGSMVTYSGSKLPGKGTRYANRVPVFYGGQLLNYEKHVEAGEAGAGGIGTFRNGTHDGDFRVQFGASNYRFAVEVCGEHAAGFAANAGYAAVDVHIITANTVGFDPANAIGTRYNLVCNATGTKVVHREKVGVFATCAVYDAATGQAVTPDLNSRNELFRWDLVL